MSKTKSFKNPALQNNSSSNSFNLASVTNPLNSIFQIRELDRQESNAVEKIIVDYYIPNHRTEPESANDATVLKKITAEIKAITKQGLLLVGERVAQAREILKPYKDGAFTKWLESTFASRRSGYNILGYYELYKALPEQELKERFKKIPQKVAYVLASREGNIEKKAEIINQYRGQSADEMILIIQERFPADLEDGRSGNIKNLKLIGIIDKALRKLYHRKTSLSKDNKKDLERFRKLIDAILPEP